MIDVANINKKLSNVYKSMSPKSKFYILGILIILILTLIFFWPMVTRLTSYSPGGDASFNAWTLARDQYCIMGQNCSNFLNGTIFYPHTDTMLYSETQLSAALLTLPLFWFNHNPLLSYNFWSIASFFFSGLFMYMLAMYLSKNKVLISVLAALVFEFAPLKMAAIFHLQNLSIFYLPLAFLLIFKYIDRKKRWYLVSLFIVLVLQFYASWYQMAFVLVALVVALICFLIFKYTDWRKVAIISAITLLAVITTLPLAIQYIHFSKTTGASFNITQQATYSSSLSDYFIPNTGTLLGKLYYDVRQHAQINSYNPDSWSYHGVTIYILSIIIIVFSFIRFRSSKKIEFRKYHKQILMFMVMAVVAFILSLGPLLKLKGSYLYSIHTAGISAALPMPYIIIDKLFPQLSFIRAIGRISVLTLFALCCTLAFLPAFLSTTKLKKNVITYILVAVVVLVAIDILPDHRFSMSSDPMDYNLSIPSAYKFIHNDNKIKNYIVLAADNKTDYSNVPYDDAISSELIWGGYANKDMFNGTSGYIPPEYYPQYISFLNFTPTTEQQLAKLGISYVMVDKLLSVGTNLTQNAHNLLSSHLVYTDKRYDIYSLN